jgi:hypothetical protein
LVVGMNSVGVAMFHYQPGSLSESIRI